MSSPVEAASGGDVRPMTEESQEGEFIDCIGCVVKGTECNLRSGVIIIFFCFFASLAREGKK